MEIGDGHGVRACNCVYGKAPPVPYRLCADSDSRAWFDHCGYAIH
jgi:hypothetical protein